MCKLQTSSSSGKKTNRSSQFFFISCREMKFKAQWEVISEFHSFCAKINIWIRVSLIKAVKLILQVFKRFHKVVKLVYIFLLSKCKAASKTKSENSCQLELDLKLSPLLYFKDSFGWEKLDRFGRKSNILLYDVVWQTYWKCPMQNLSSIPLNCNGQIEWIIHEYHQNLISGGRIRE